MERSTKRDLDPPPPPAENVWTSGKLRTGLINVSMDTKSAKASNQNAWPSLSMRMKDSRSTSNPPPKTVRPFFPSNTENCPDAEVDPDSSGWTVVGKQKASGETSDAPKPPKTEEELEEIRRQRRERRKKLKENKKKAKEEEKRRKIYESKSSKIQFISSDVLSKVSVAQSVDSEATRSTLKGAGEIIHSSQSTNNNSLRLLDEEYPALAASELKRDLVEAKLVKQMESSLKLSDVDRGSKRKPKPGLEEEIDKNPKMTSNSIINELDDKISVIINSKPVTFSSILKSSNQIKSDQISQNKSKDPNLLTSQPVHEEVKKIRRKDLVTFDLLAAIQPKISLKKTERKSLSASGISKSKKKILVRGGNKLDSSAPSIRRGKEREKPKKKKKSKMKIIILADRAKRREERLRNQTQHSDKDSSTLPLPDTRVPNDEPIIEKSLDEDLKVHFSFKPPNLKCYNCDAVRYVTGVSRSQMSQVEDLMQLSLEGKEKSEAKAEKEDEILETEKRESFNDLTPVEKAQLLIHSRKFRNYCTHDLSEELNEHCKNLLVDIVRFQDNMFAKDEVKARARRRYVVGLREVKKFLIVKKVSMLIVAPDIEPVNTKGGLDDMIRLILTLAKENEIPIFYCMNRKRLGFTTLRKRPIACIGILNYQGTEDNFKKMNELLPKLERSYREKLENALKSVNSNLSEEIQDNEDIVAFDQSQPMIPESWHPGFPYAATFDPGTGTTYFSGNMIDYQYHYALACDPSFRPQYPIEDPSEEIKREFLKKLKQ